MLFRAVLPLLALAPRVVGAGGRWLCREARGPVGARVLMYHGVPQSGAAGFERQMRFLRRQFEVVPLGALLSPIEAFRGRIKVALTFDDGLRNNVTTAFPILRKLGLPATFFVCPQLIDRGMWLWNQQARQRLKRLPPAALRTLAAEAGAPGGEVEPFIQWMKSLAPAPRREVEARIRKATPAFYPTPAERDAFDLASWSELRSLPQDLISIGSHTLTHPILTTLDEPDLEVEIGGSRRVLEEKLQRPVELFAYPNGSQNPMVLACARRHYRAAVLAAGHSLSTIQDPHLMPRECAPQGVLRLARSLLRETALQ